MSVIPNPAGVGSGCLALLNVLLQNVLSAPSCQCPWGHCDLRWLGDAEVFPFSCRTRANLPEPSQHGAGFWVRARKTPLQPTPRKPQPCLAHKYHHFKPLYPFLFESCTCYPGTGPLGEGNVLEKHPSDSSQMLGVFSSASDS